VQRPQDLFIAHDVLAEETQEVHAHETRIFTSQSVPAIPARLALPARLAACIKGEIFGYRLS
jgi:hypothetical protein